MENFDELNEEDMFRDDVLALGNLFIVAPVNITFLFIIIQIKIY